MSWLSNAFKNPLNAIGAAGGFGGGIGQLPFAYQQWQQGGGNGTGGAGAQYGGGNPYLQYLPPSGNQIAQLGYGSGAAGNAINQLTGIRSTQLADFLSSQGLQRSLTPMQAQTDMMLAGQLIPQQLEQQAGFQNQEYDLLAGSKAFGNQIQNFQLGQAGANALGGSLFGIGQNIQGLQGGISDILGGKLPQGIANTIQDSLFSTATQFGLQRSPSAMQDIGQQLGTSLAGIQSQLLGSYAGASGSLVGQGGSVLQSLFGAAGQNVPGMGSLLANTGIPDIGFGPLGFGGAAGVYGKTLQQDQMATQNRRNAYAAYGNMGANLLGSAVGAFMGAG